MTDVTTYQPNDRVYRWWYTFANEAEQQALTVVRVNRKTITVRTDAGSEFRIDPALIAGYLTDH